ncbi:MULTISPECIES: hypothetical protein [Methylophaga]|uniref:hypothetical protein n=1 Tax=Methylophaga TaxID=40222 RepID=UPI001CF5C34F|nr:MULTISPECIES: hypothetical protein [Methylophaga]MCB2425430.1 hypothetical protein [Methylophaga pinxianii]MDO8826030.1 hypothetical protein [Methylophaga sp.]UPH47200.1 hypothetical protein LGT42_015415 [Methylophaga pinxianii]
MMSLQAINQRTLQQLVDDGLVHSATAVPNNDHWELVVNYGQVSRVLATTPGNKVRTWSKMDTLIEYIAKLGITKLETDLTDYTAGVKTSRKRPDRAEAMRQTHEAAKHDLWFREQVNTALAEADSPDAKWIKAEDVRTRMKQRAKSRLDAVND